MMIICDRLSSIYLHTTNEELSVSGRYITLNVVRDDGCIWWKS